VAIPINSSWSETNGRHSNTFQAVQNQSLPFQSIPVGQNQRRPFKYITGILKAAVAIPIHFGQAKTDCHHSNPFQAVQNQRIPFQAIPVGQNQRWIFKSIPDILKPTVTIPIHSSQAKINGRHSNPFQAVQNQLWPVVQ
jgi:L-ascorbate metabolism protein UlaG (beta-lactamase superfamily)